MEFHARETAEGRSVSAEWGWIVPPQAPAACEVFHLAMTDLGAVPNYYRSRSEDGSMLMPYYGDAQRSRLAARLDRNWRRWKLRGRSPTSARCRCSPVHSCVGRRLAAAQAPESMIFKAGP
jgi:nitric-oxide synthase